jgi:hypothetical protein
MSSQGGLTENAVMALTAETKLVPTASSVERYYKKLRQDPRPLEMWCAGGCRIIYKDTYYRKSAVVFRH